ncbi:MAG: tRNA pseudouridine(55) synthase TruB [Deltaproteobacteria bacterium]|nr:tRNA pseudouridine(55) synthase TruB [Deltaproteobacteria bacterium]
MEEMKPGKASLDNVGPDAFIVLDKPAGISSQKAVSRVRNLLRVKKAGHTGTLDPFATGVLPVCLNQATKASRFFLESDKVYEAAMTLGVDTDTLDITGKVTSERSVYGVRSSDVEEAGKGLLGRRLQLVPAYSAVKLNGTRLYKLARQGIKVQMPSREVEVKELEVLDIQLPKVAFRVRCSSGTYVRSLASEWGQMLGCGAHVSELRRIRCGSFGIDKAVTFQELESGYSSGALDRLLVGLNEALGYMPSIQVRECLAKRIRQGSQLGTTHLDEEIVAGLQSAPILRVLSEEDDLVAIMSPVFDAENRRIEKLRSLRVFN